MSLTQTQKIECITIQEEGHICTFACNILRFYKFIEEKHTLNLKEATVALRLVENSMYNPYRNVCNMQAMQYFTLLDDTAISDPASACDVFNICR